MGIKIILLLILITEVVIAEFLVVYFYETKPQSKAAYVFYKYVSPIIGVATGLAIGHLLTAD